MNIHEILYKYWGYSQFRPLQEDIVQSIIEGMDSLALLPTGGGKSVCYQVPAMATEGMCLVVSPLIALIKDQVDGLTAKGIPALMIHSGMGFKQVDTVLKLAITGQYKFLFVSPERLETKLFLEYLPGMEINMIAVDEAHCISQWGYDFRPPYIRIATIRDLLSEAVPVLALTASATKKVQLDICEKLAFKNDYKLFQKSFTRPNLSYSNIEVGTKINKLTEILQKVAGTAIVYCSTRKRTQEVAQILQGYGINADFYHAGLTNEERSRKQQDWIDDKIRVIVSTNAFGMGIDKPNVRVVIHIDVPDCLENYYQEAGRAGRDEQKAYAALLYNEADLIKLENAIDIKYPAIDTIKNCYVDLCNHLQIPEGAPANQQFEIDISKFIKTFNYDAMVFANCLKQLEQNEYVAFNNSMLIPSTAHFICSKESFRNFETQHPHVAEVAKSLLRTYGGIWDYPCFINEKNLAFINKKDFDYIIAQLNRLNSLGIIDYQAADDAPKIQLLKNRIHFNYITIDEARYNERRNNYLTNVTAFINFVKNKTDCRSLQISNYFGVAESSPCGICDNCIANKKAKISPDINMIEKEIIQLLQQNSFIDTQFVNQQKQSELWKIAIKNLINEEKVTHLNDKIFLAK